MGFLMGTIAFQLLSDISFVLIAIFSYTFWAFYQIIDIKTAIC